MHMSENLHQSIVLFLTLNSTVFFFREYPGEFRDSKVRAQGGSEHDCENCLSLILRMML